MDMEDGAKSGGRSAASGTSSTVPKETSRAPRREKSSQGGGLKYEVAVSLRTMPGKKGKKKAKKKR
jgi:hypothetical protein